MGWIKQKKNVFSFQGEKQKRKRILLFTLLNLFSFLSRAEFHNNNHSLTTQDALVKKITETDDDANRETRAEGRGLWDVIVNNDDICFQHILPRLNGTELKFLYEVNTETRKLIKRSSRANDLREKFKVKEMSSISTLEVAWEHKSWSFWLSGTRFCSEVAQTNKLEFLKWAREEKKCEWDSGAINVAAYQGNLEMVKYCVANECPINEYACAYAAENGHLECLKYLREDVKAPWDWETAYFAAQNGHLHILEYLVERKYDEYHALSCVYAARNGHLDCLKYLREPAKAPWNYWAVLRAHKKNQTECLQYLLDNNCPLPEGWSYEGGGILHTNDSDDDFVDDDSSNNNT